MFLGRLCVNAAVLINRLPTPILPNKTSFEALYHKKPNYSYLKTFGCLSLVYNSNTHTDTLSARGIPCFFLCYPSHQKGYKFLNLLCNQTFISRDAKLYESVFPYTFPTHTIASLIPKSLEHSITVPSP